MILKEFYLKGNIYNWAMDHTWWCNAENGKKYVAAVCQYTTILKDAPPGFDGQKYEVNYMKNIQPMKQVPNYPARSNEVSRKVNIGMRGGNLMIGKRHQEDDDEDDEGVVL